MAVLSDVEDVFSFDDVVLCVSSALVTRSANPLEESASTQTPTPGNQESDNNEVSSKNDSSKGIRIQYDKEELEVEMEWEAEEDSEQSSKEESINPVKLSTCVNAVSLIIKLKHIASSHDN